MSYFTHLTAADVVRAAMAAGIDPNALLFADDSYLLPGRNWVETTFAKAWVDTMSVLRLAQYRADSNDCDDFARMCAGYAQLLNNATVVGSREPGNGPVMPNAGLAFGEFWFTPPQGAHAINAYFYTEAQGTPPKIGFMEPQTGSRLVLSQAEIKSCSLFRL